MLETQGAACKAVKRVITHSGVGTGNSVTLKRLVTNSDVRTEIDPLDILQSATGRVAKQSERAHGSVASSRGITQKRARADCRVEPADGITPQRQKTIRSVESAGGQAKKGSLPFRCVAARIPAIRCWDNRSRNWQKCKAREPNYDCLKCII